MGLAQGHEAGAARLTGWNVRRASVIDAGMTDFAALREAMVARQIAARGITGAALLAAMREVPREAFVSAALARPGL